MDAFLDPYVLDPIAADAGVEGDESYNNVNTVLYVSPSLRASSPSLPSSVVGVFPPMIVC